MIIGFTGTAQGMTHAQKVGLVGLLESLDGIAEFHHGICVGSDAQAHFLFRSSKHGRGEIIGHIPINKGMVDQHALADCDHVRPPFSFLVRNGNIVSEADKIIATPRGMEEELRSGTWSTVRYARKAKRPLYIIWPNGIYSTT